MSSALSSHISNGEDDEFDIFEMGTNDAGEPMLRHAPLGDASPVEVREAEAVGGPMDMLPEGFEYHNGNDTLYLVGEFDRESGIFTEQSNQTVDYGIDFYAPQTIRTPDGRTIMIAWMQNWDTTHLHSPETRWFGQMTLPRELSLKNGRLIQKLIRELEGLRCNKVEYKEVAFTDTIRLDGIEGRRVDMEIELAPLEEQEMYHKFAVHFAQNDRFHTAVSFRPTVPS